MRTRHRPSFGAPRMTLIEGIILVSVVGMVALVVAGVRKAAKMPPEVVIDRGSRIETRSYSCGYKGNDTCYSPETVYFVVSERGATCDVLVSTYYAVQKGESFKCTQLFGWRGGRPRGSW